MKKFEELKSLMHALNSSLPESYYISSFVNGLKEDIKPILKILKPVTFVAPSRRERGGSDNPRLISGSLLFCVKESPPSIMVTKKPNWSFRDSKARDWLRKGKVLAPLVRPT